jgi:hypothetical protein
MIAPRVTWRGKTLRVDFNLQYTHANKGSQQGKILILARGPETLLAYPDSAFAPVGSPSLVLPDHGEYFSVSRFREVNAEFGPLRSTNVIQEVEILLFNKEGKLIVYQRVKPAAPPVHRAPPPEAVTSAPSAAPADPSMAAPKAISPAPASGDFIEPGFDR